VQNSEGNAGWPYNDGDGLLMKGALIGRYDRIKPGLVVAGARQNNLDAFGGLAHGLAAGAVAPLAGSIADGQAIGKARGNFACNKARPGAFAHSEPVSDVAPEQQFGDLPDLLRAVTGSGVRGSRRLCMQAGALRRNDKCETEETTAKSARGAAQAGQTSLAGEKPYSRIKRSRVMAAEPAAHSTNAHVTPNKKLRITARITPVP
jgi:hypothetical protein